MNSNQEQYILELRSGVGGQESNMFVEQLLRMYCRFIIKNNWDFKIKNITKVSSGGIREVIVIITGIGIKSWIINECGVHCVQRVPITESKGRIHTSTVTIVGLLINNEEYNISIKKNDIRIETMRSTGAGGQHVNTTDSAVRVTHLPTGISSICSQKSQHRNKVDAMICLKQKLDSCIAKAKNIGCSTIREKQIARSIRTAKVRTYSFVRDNVIDHRLGITVRGVTKILDGNLELINPVCRL
ncbi:Peptide chain release factor 1 [Candidatus Hodgkinia cicadicola]|uniref:Peptide chain release factor 1 n=1 Tax=Candidatus Hodgkinia cicadicola TaxID=573658 RepID=A0ABX4MJ66_9HYPH|nr:Peptide chain release factor 1 [Candidatus Hodgkinia cicadicola]